MRFNGVGEQFAGAFLKLRDAEVRIARLERGGLHTLNLDYRTGEREFDRIGFALAHDGQTDRRVGAATHLFDGIIQRHALDRVVIELDDEVTRHHARARGRGVVDR